MPENARAPGRKPRVLLVNWRDIRNPEAGGAEVHLHEVAMRMARAGYVCGTFLTVDGALSAAFATLGEEGSEA